VVLPLVLGLGACGGAALGPPGTGNAIAAPRLVAPLSTETVTRVVPTLQVAPVAGETGFQIEVCKDRGCTNVLETIAGAGAAVTVPSALPAGLYFWRARGMADGKLGTETSATWELRIPHRDDGAGPDTAWGTELDANGDGLADLAVGDVGEVGVYLGNTSGVPASGTLLAPPAGSSATFGEVLTRAGDVNGDGYGDLLVGARLGAQGGSVYLYLGGAAGLAAAPAQTFASTVSGFGDAMAAVGDVNHDGYADVVIVEAGVGQAVVYQGATDGLHAALALPVPAWTSGSTVTVGSAGDVDGDGSADVVVGSNFEASVFRGGAGGVGAQPWATLTGPMGIYPDPPSFNASFAGDVDGDGYADLALGAVGGEAALVQQMAVYRGGPAGYASTPTTMSLLGGTAPTGGGDIDGDGYDDLLSGTTQWGGVLLAWYQGQPGGISMTPVPEPTTEPDTPTPDVVRILGDVDGDGLDDVAVGAGGTGRVLLYMGGSPSGFPQRTQALSGIAGFGTSID
jgi:hypothetical protein